MLTSLKTFLSRLCGHGSPDCAMPPQSRDATPYAPSPPWAEETEFFYRVFRNHNGYSSTKYEPYLPVYSRLLAPWIATGRPLDLLEIGIQNGGSLQMWADCLPQGSKIHGIDINPKCAELAFQEGISVSIGDASNKPFLNQALANGQFDVIIDDGSHIAEHVVASFEILFPRLKPGGIYVVEDCCTSYWPSHHGDFRLATAPVEYFKRLVDAVNFDHIGGVPTTLSHDEHRRLRDLNQEIAGIQFYDSLIVVEKYIRLKKRRFKNFFTDGPGLVADKQACVNIGGIAVDLNTRFEKYFR